MQFSSTTTQGMRERNEDTIFPLPGQASQGLFIVADGLGGHVDGKVASELAVQLVREIIEKEDPREYVMGGARLAEDELLRAFLSDVVRNAGKKFWHAARQLGTDMGTTLLVVLIEAERGFCAQVGDCALFVSQDGRMPMRKLTVEHRKGTKLTRSFGAEEHIDADVLSFEFTPDSILVMGCDGFWEHVTLEQMSQMAVERPYFVLADELAQAALHAGSQDNVSVIVVEGEGFIKTHAAQQAQDFTNHIQDQYEPVYATVLAWPVRAFEARYGDHPHLDRRQPVPLPPVATQTVVEQQGGATELSEKLDLFTNQLAVLQSANKDLSQKLAAATAEQAHLAEQNAELIKEREQARLAAFRKKNEPDQALEQSATLTAENMRLLQAYERIKEVVDEQQKEIDTGKAKLVDHQSRLRTAQAKVEQLEFELKDAQTALRAQMERSQLLEQTSQEKQSQVVALLADKSQAAQLSVDKANLLDQVNRLTQQLEEQKQLVVEGQAKFSQLEQIAHQLEVMKNDAEKNLSALAGQQTEILKSRDDLRDVVRGNQAQLNQLLDQNAELERRYAALVNEKKNQENILENTRQAAEELQNKLNRLSSSARYLNSPAPVANTDVSADPNKIELINRVNKLIAEKQQLYQENKALRDELDSVPSSRAEVNDLKYQIDSLKRYLEEKDAIIKQKEQQLKLQPSRPNLLASTDYDPQAQIQLLKDENEKLAREVLFQRGNNLTIYRRLLELHDKYPVQCEEVLTQRWINNIRKLVDEATRNESPAKR